MYTTLITATQLLAHPDAIVFDCRFDLADPAAGATAYATGHIPGAHYLHLDQDLSGAKTGRNGRHPLPEAETLLEKLRACGVHNDSQVIACDAHGGMFAARLWWLLRWLGHEAVAVLDGGLPAWQASGGVLTQALPPPRSGALMRRPSLQHVVTANEVLANLTQNKFLIVDARAPDRFRGENETLDPIGGHIPGACNRFFKDNLQADGCFKNAAQLGTEWRALLQPRTSKETIQQCGSGVTACHNILALEIAGLTRPALYAGSWSEWCADPTHPVATGNS